MIMAQKYEIGDAYESLEAYDRTTAVSTYNKSFFLYTIHCITKLIYTFTMEVRNSFHYQQ